MPCRILMLCRIKILCRIRILCLISTLYYKVSGRYTLSFNFTNCQWWNPTRCASSPHTLRLCTPHQLHVRRTPTLLTPTPNTQTRLHAIQFPAFQFTVNTYYPASRQSAQPVLLFSPSFLRMRCLSFAQRTDLLYRTFTPISSTFRIVPTLCIPKVC